MSTDFSDLYGFDSMSDDEIRGLVLQQLTEYPNLDSDWIRVDVRNGFVTLSGSVGTDGEVQVAEAVVADVLGINDYQNDLVVNELHRSMMPEAADDAIALDNALVDPLGEEGSQQSDTADHLMTDVEEETFGTHNMQDAIRDGTSYSPPDSPISDGYRSGENH